MLHCYTTSIKKDQENNGPIEPLLLYYSTDLIPRYKTVKNENYRICFKILKKKQIPAILLLVYVIYLILFSVVQNPVHPVLRRVCALPRTGTPEFKKLHTIFIDCHLQYKYTLKLGWLVRQLGQGLNTF